MVIVGAGLAGSLLALVLGRQGRRVSIVDLERTYPSDFRCEKLSPAQVALLADLGALGCFDGVDLARQGLRYETMVAALRAAWPAQVRFIEGRVASLATSDNVQMATLANGERLTARLLVLATGPGEKLRASLGIRRRMLRERHSLCTGFTLVRRDGQAMTTVGMVRHGEVAGDRVGYASLFPMDGALRVNFFSYHHARDDWTRRLRAAPLAGLREVLPSLTPVIDGMTLAGPVEMRSTDLYVTEGHIQPGVVLIGDASATCCPATGMGVTRILTDVGQLANAYLADWLASPGMATEKIAQFYADPTRRRIDALARRKAETSRSAATETSLGWRAYRGLAWLKRGSTALARSTFAPRAERLA
ncbi:MAG: FAD-dependent oxidoreductase [Caulobacterales bacterium]